MAVASARGPLALAPLALAPPALALAPPRLRRRFRRCAAGASRGASLRSFVTFVVWSVAGGGRVGGGGGVGALWRSWGSLQCASGRGGRVARVVLRGGGAVPRRIARALPHFSGPAGGWALQLSHSERKRAHPHGAGATATADPRFVTKRLRLRFPRCPVGHGRRRRSPARRAWATRRRGPPVDARSTLTLVCRGFERWCEEAGEIPARSRHCDRGASSQDATAQGSEGGSGAAIRKPGDLPIAKLSSRAGRVHPAGGPRMIKLRPPAPVQRT
ncbi:MAG: hypothetical protein QOC78_854 [Solirubrobacteraceae bacterium]|nr:hypothetical protein [Solirubrobacteraceae bacterium]